MAILADLFAREGARLGEQGKWLGTAFAGAWLDAPGAQANSWLGDQDHEGMDSHRVGRVPRALLPDDPQLHRVLEAELARDLIGQERGLCHQGV